MKEHILIIESNTVELRKLREIFSREGFNVMTSTDLETAKDIIEKINVRYVVSEISIFNYFQTKKINKNLEEK